MVIPIKLKDDPLMKDIPETATKFEYENMLFVILHPERKEFDFLIINKELPEIHYHIYQDQGEVYFHKTFYEKGVKKREPIDIEKSLKTLAEIMSSFFSKIEKIETNDPMFTNELVYFQNIHPMFVKNKTEQRVIFGQLYDVEAVRLGKIDTNYPKLGFSFDDNGKEKDMIFVKDGNIFRLEIKKLDNFMDTSL